MFAYNSLPPDPEVVGARWRDMWFEASRRQRPSARDMAAPQRRDGYWRHGSIAEDYAAVQMPHHGRQAAGPTVIPTPSSGFWPISTYPAEGSSVHGATSIPISGGFRALPSGSCRNACAGGTVAQGLGYGASWKTRCCASGCRTACRRAPATTRAPGGWVAEPVWPSGNVSQRRIGLGPGRILGDGEVARTDPLPIQSPLTVGVVRRQVVFLRRRPRSRPRPAAGRMAARWSSTALRWRNRWRSWGMVCVERELSADRLRWAHGRRLRLSERRGPNGKATRVTYGVLNLTHRDSPRASRTPRARAALPSCASG